MNNHYEKHFVRTLLSVLSCSYLLINHQIIVQLCFSIALSCYSLPYKFIRPNIQLKEAKYTGSCDVSKINSSMIREPDNQSAAEQIIHSFVTSRLDNRNALFYGLPQNQISRLQHIQNTAARVVTLSRKSCHISPILKELHWLPVSQNCFYTYANCSLICNNIAPIYISELLKVYTPSRNLRSSNMSLQNGPGVIGLFLSRLRESGIIFQLNSNLVIV